MRSRLVLATGLLAALLLVAYTTPAASAHDWGYSGHYAFGATPLWHSFSGYGSYRYYGLGAYNFVPQSRFYAYPYSGGYSGYYSPYGLAYPYYYSYPYYSVPPYYYGY
jgi:hypothetical protein